MSKGPSPLQKSFLSLDSILFQSYPNGQKLCEHAHSQESSPGPMLAYHVSQV